MDAIRESLSELGLGDTEITVYLSLLKSGTSPASAVSQRTGIGRSTTQYACQQLAKKGAASVTRKDGVFLFTAEPPDRLTDLLDRERKAIDEKEKRLQKVMGPLKQMMNPHTMLPKIQFYEGPEGLIRLYDSILDMRKPIDSFEDSGKIFELIPDYAAEFPRRRAARKIPNRCVAPSGSPMNVSDPAKYLEVRHLDPARYPFTWQIRICGDLVGVFSFEEGAAVAIGIRHADIARNFRLLFEYVWDTLDGQAGRACQE